MNIIKIEIEEELLATKILKLLSYMQTMGIVGHSAELTIEDEFSCFIDGDGSDRIKKLSINNISEKEWMNYLFKKSIFTYEEKKYFLNNKFIYNFFGDAPNSFQFFDGDKCAYSYIDVQKDNFDAPKINYFLTIYYKSKIIKLSDNLTIFQNFKGLKNFIDPLIIKKIHKDWTQTKINFEKLGIKKNH